MASDDYVDPRDCHHPRYGDDTTPLVSTVQDPPPSHWGTVTSRGRTLSQQYLKFLKKPVEVTRDRK